MQDINIKTLNKLLDEESTIIINPKEQKLHFMAQHQVKKAVIISHQQFI